MSFAALCFGTLPFLHKDGARNTKASLLGTVHGVGSENPSALADPFNRARS